MAELFAEDYPFGFRKLDDFESIAAAEEEMLARYDGGLEVDFLIKDSGGQFSYKEHTLNKVSCPRCGGDSRPFRMFMTHDCQGIPFRRVCSECWNQVLEIGYDGAEYGAEDECLDYDF